MNKKLKWGLIIVGGMAVVGGMMDNGKTNGDHAPKEAPKVVNTTPAPTNVQPKEEPKNKPTITLAEFQQVKNGMTYEEVVKIIGGQGTLQSEAGDGKYKIEMYSWDGEGGFGANANVTFQGGKVTAKAQIGLQ